MTVLIGRWRSSTRSARTWKKQRDSAALFENAVPERIVPELIVNGRRTETVGRLPAPLSDDRTPPLIVQIHKIPRTFSRPTISR